MTNIKTDEEIKVTYEETPNPLSRKFKVNIPIAEETVQFNSPQEAQRSPLAAKIFGFPWTDAIFIGQDFVTITKQDWVDWETLSEPLAGLIQEHIQEGQPVLLPNETTTEVFSDDPKVQTILQVINDEIRPAVALDGGDIIFKSYENNKVYIYMQGACSGCPSSTYTLKMGIETRLKEALPEIDEVIAL